MTEKLARICTTLVGSAPSAITLLNAGGNSQIYRLGYDAQTYALKCYPDLKADPRPRREVEFNALSFLWGNGVRNIMQPVATDENENASVFGWLDGKAPDKSKKSVCQLGDFFVQLQDLIGEARNNGRILHASAACVENGAIKEQFYGRFRSFLPLFDVCPELQAFLSGEVEPFAKKHLDALEQGGWLAEVPAQTRVLSVSDFGLHNALAGGDGRLSFVDFEYFGWDDAVKAVSDVLWHPAMALDENLQNAFLKTVCTPLEKIVPDFGVRFEKLFPAYGLLWVLIILNEYRADFATKRKIPYDNVQKNAILNTQLEKAKSLFIKIKECA